MARKQEQPTGLVDDPKLLKKLIAHIEQCLDIVSPKWRKNEPYLIEDPADKLLFKQLIFQHEYLVNKRKWVRKEDMKINTDGRMPFVQGIRRPSTRLVRPDRTKKVSQ